MDDEKTPEEVEEEMRTRIRLLGVCGCKNRCQEEDTGIGQRPRALGVCAMKAEDAGVMPEGE